MLNVKLKYGIFLCDVYCCCDVVLVFFEVKLFLFEDSLILEWEDFIEVNCFLFDLIFVVVMVVCSYIVKGKLCFVMWILKKVWEV